MANIWFSSERIPLMRSRICTPAAMVWPSLSSNEGAAPSIENLSELGIICKTQSASQLPIPQETEQYPSSTDLR
jgi:hypothetical protein